MIIGECPYCNYIAMTDLGPTGSASLQSCNSCLKEYWLMHSRIDPVAYTKEDFEKKYKIDKEKKTITELK